MFKPIEKVKSWSISQLNLYDQCPEKYKYVKIDKKEEPKSVHLQRGLDVHSLAEEYVKAKGEMNVPKELVKLSKYMKALVKHNSVSEEKIVLNNKWEHIPGDSWFSPEAWLRIILDARVDNLLIDFKTGKQYDSHIRQARLYANCYMCIDETYDEIDVEYWYVDTGKTSLYTFYRKDLEQHKKEWEDKVNIMHNDTVYAPKQNQYCKYCHFIDICTLFS